MLRRVRAKKSAGLSARYLSISHDQNLKGRPRGFRVPTGRPRDMEDVAAVVRARRDLDLEGVRGTLRLLERALSRADLVVELERIVASARKGQTDQTR